ncbi:MAG: penicillin-binding protein 2 [Oscillospiraceae bacterium]|nr:penicillin-binding protein 2 [Oscillospiraceae bacterium]
MRTKRIFLLYVFFLIMLNGLILRLWWLTNDPSLAQAAAKQQSCTLTLARQRPDFFDRNGQPLTGVGQRTLAVLFPAETASWNAAPYLDEAGKQLLRSGMAGDMPFAVELCETPPQWALLETVTLRTRLSQSSLLTHLIGYTDSEGKGVCGLERVFDSYLSENSAAVQLRMTVDALGRPTEGADAQLLQPEQQAGITLTVDSAVQQAAENAADAHMQRGAVVVLDAASGHILAWVSRPNYDRLNVAAELSRTDGAFLDRVDLAYPAGSVYKIVVAAAALEAGMELAAYECTGSTEVDGMRFQCNNAAAHGLLSMETALMCSCNCYFIELGQQLGAQPILAAAKSLGLGSGALLCEGFAAEAGNLPTAQQLSQKGQLALHCFGQGQLLVTPLQVAAMTRAVAMQGCYTPPRLILGIGEQAAAGSEAVQALQSETAKQLTAYLTRVVEEGTGKAGAPQAVSAAAKTGTAQTGQYDAAGRETLIGWYTGFFPAEAPQYIVTVMMEGVTYGSADAGPVFAAVADALTTAQTP